ncbi:hypothetical protein E1286_31820 [Nonomuraea terrae]|uniref:Uncharacterized protein n=1 Tax=Nonomuraea terrae TaxID=2530383 RepID=A0A4R4YDH7_9ACTN|nr:hypothetical protein [Nonomuraea terrae]TDD41944.1 hypothetical protein E1286_31820 [Nonomuraea terrae]
MSRPSIFECAGGEDAFLALAAAHHRRCLLDPVLNHPFSRGTRPDHVRRLADYWGERQALRAYMVWAVDDVLTCAPPGSEVPAGLRVPRWSWHGLERR